MGQSSHLIQRVKPRSLETVVSSALFLQNKMKGKEDTSRTHCGGQTEDKLVHRGEGCSGNSQCEVTVEWGHGKGNQAQ